ncbi:MAG TPA: hypothetical protein VGG29_18380 [Caulobacteraceae bacterium]
MGLAVITRIPRLVEAQIAVGALRASGIDAELFDGSFGATESPVIEGLGGYRLMAPEDQVAEARETLKALRASPGLPLPDDEPPWGAAMPSYQLRRRRLQLVAAILLAAPTIAWLIARLFR